MVIGHHNWGWRVETGVYDGTRTVPATKMSLASNVSSAEVEKLTMKSKHLLRASLVAQWLRIHLPMQGTWVQALVQEDPTCRGATKPVHYNC